MVDASTANPAAAAAIPAESVAQQAADDACDEIETARAAVAEAERMNKARARVTELEADLPARQAAAVEDAESEVESEGEPELPEEEIRRRAEADALWPQIDTLLTQLERRDTRQRLEADARKVWGSESGSGAPKGV